MRKLLLTLVLACASIGVIGMTPSRAEARWWNRGYVSSYYYPGYTYYYPSSSYFYPGYSYGYATPGYTLYYYSTPYTTSYYSTPAYSYGTYYYTPSYSYGYYGPGMRYYWR